ncbi:MAG TPA: FkbM family methyltransferase [bacterium]|nr:FkbM family methyltransferase [bacterium]
MRKQKIRLDPGIINYLSNNPIYAVDVGASGGVDNRWDVLKEFVHWVLFEPDDKACHELKTIYPDYKIFDCALSDKTGWKNLFSCKFDRCSSLLEPAPGNCQEFYLKKSLKVVNNRKIFCRTLDDIYESGELPFFNFVKMDVQGGELDVLKGGLNAIKKSKPFSIQTEVLFYELYKNQPTFTDINALLKELGYDLFDMKFHYMRRESFNNDFVFPGQVIYGDVLYLKGINITTEFQDQDIEAYITKAVLICLIFGYPDYALSLIKSAEKHNKMELNNVKRLLKMNIDLFKGIRCSKAISYFKYRVNKMLKHINIPTESGSSKVGFDVFG